MYIITVSYSPYFKTPMKPIKSCHYDFILLLATLVRVSDSFYLSNEAKTVSRLRITARVLPILRLNLMLPLWFQGLGTCCWLDFTRWDSHPLDYVHRTSAPTNVANHICCIFPTCFNDKTCIFPTDFVVYIAFFNTFNNTY